MNRFNYQMKLIIIIMASKYIIALAILSLLFTKGQAETSAKPYQISDRFLQSKQQPNSYTSQSFLDKHPFKSQQIYKQDDLAKQSRDISANSIKNSVNPKTGENSEIYYGSVQEREENIRRIVNQADLRNKEIQTPFKKTSQELQSHQVVFGQDLKNMQVITRPNSLKKMHEQRTESEFQSDFINHQEKTLYFRFIEIIAKFAETVIRGIPPNQQKTTDNMTEKASQSLLSKPEKNTTKMMANGQMQNSQIKTIQSFEMKNQMIVKDTYQVRKSKKLSFIVSVFSFGFICVALIKFFQYIQKTDKHQKSRVMRLPSEDYEIQQI